MQNTLVKLRQSKKKSSTYKYFKNLLHIVKFIKGIRENPNFFFTKNNIGSYIKALTTNYKPVFIELKSLILLLSYCFFFSSF